MTLHNPPQYRYALFDEWDRQTYDFIKELAKTKKYPTIVGTKEEKNQFLTTLIRTQKSLHDWRDFLRDVIDQVRGEGSIQTEELNRKYPPESILKDTPVWVTYEEDKIVSNFIDELATRHIEFFGEDAEVGEFVLRFILGQLGHDWEQTIYMIWEMLGDEDRLSVSELNKELRNFDYCHFFE